jgi:hypothetical protein
MKHRSTRRTEELGGSNGGNYEINHVKSRRTQMGKIDPYLLDISVYYADVQIASSIYVSRRRLDGRALGGTRGEFSSKSFQLAHWANRALVRRMPPTT